LNEIIILLLIFYPFSTAVRSHHIMYQHNTGRFSDCICNRRN